MQNRSYINHSSQLSHNHCLKILFTVSKIFFSGILALIVLTIFCTFYYNLHQHYPDTDGATDYLFDAHKFGSKFTEGFAWFVSNNEGYNNTFDYKKNMPINTLIMGSSHMEGTNIMPKYNTTNLLHNLSGKTVYNIGISGHGFPTCAANFESALKKYKSEYTVIETGSIIFSEDTLTKILENKITKIPAYSKGILSLLRRNNFLRLIYAQFFKDLFKSLVLKTPKQNSNIAKIESNNSILLSKVLNKLGNIASKSKTKLIIAYHPLVSLQTDGTLKIESNPEVSQQFSELCAQNGIYFLDMSERFLNEYEKNFTLPYGFFNTSVATGHMNNDGHRMFADEIFKLMQRIEAQS